MSFPIDLLPIEHPRDFDPSVNNKSYFYDNVIQPLIPDMLRLSNNGIHIDLDKVKELEVVVTNVLATVDAKLASNSLMLDFQAYMYPKKFKVFKDELEARKRDISYYETSFKKSNITHRTYVANVYLRLQGKSTVERATIKVLKELNLFMKSSTLNMIIDGKCPQSIIDTAMINMAIDKLTIYNKSIDTKINTVDKDKILPKFSPASSTQKKEFFDWVGVEHLSVSKKSGNPSFPRKDLEIILKSNKGTNPLLDEVLQLFIDHSYSAIIRNNFIAAFKNYTIDGTLFGNFKLFGALSFRPTSNSPNLLQLPSTGSIYAKPVKECFTAREGTLICTADFGQL